MLGGRGVSARALGYHRAMRMAAGADAEQVVPTVEHRTLWWKEVLILASFYLVYTATRNRFGSVRLAAEGVPEQAFHNAERLIRWEQSVGLFHEQAVQSWFLGNKPFIQFWNTYYGTAHFFVTVAVMVLLYVKRPDVYPLWRNTLAAMTALAIIGYSLFPVMPPRLLDAPCPGTVPEVNHYGGACIESDLRGDDGTFGFVDTLAEFGGPWSFDSEALQSVSNQYAAMPSLHIGWASWCALALISRTRRWWVRAALVLYPAMTLFCIVVTGNHYWIDGIGGLIALAAGFVIGWSLHELNQRRLAGRRAVPVAAAVAPTQRTEPVA
jgi:membrane-associated phospholipid phosphatase